jgi:hypothetical protein
VDPTQPDRLMAASLDSVRVKLLRAGDRIAELGSLTRPISSRVQESIRTERSASTVTYRMTNVGEFSPYLSVVVGDVIHNLRSALDHLAWQLVILDGGQPTDDTQFPIYASETNAKGNPRNVTIQPGINDQHIIDALIEVQPFTEAKYGHDPATNALWIVHRLNIIDKHRLLVTIAHTIDHDLPAWWAATRRTQHRVTPSTRARCTTATW